MALNLPASATPPIMPVGGNNPLQQLRLAGIFGQQTPPNQPMPGMMDDPAGTDMTGGGMMPSPDRMGGYDPSTSASDTFQELLGNYPETEGPGILQKIVLSMLALKDPRLAASLMNQPSSEQQDWKAQIGPAQAAMTQEGQSNANLRMLANQLLTGEQAGTRLEQGDLRLEQAGERIEISRAAQELAEWKAQNPNKQFKTREDGMIVGINPQDPTNVVETGVNSGDLTDQERIDARIDAAEVAETGRVGRATTATGERKTAAELRETNIRSRPSTSASRTRSQSDINRGRLNRADAVLARNPEYEKFIKRSGTSLEISPWKKKGILFKRTGIDKATYDRIVSEIYGDEAPSSESEVIERPIPDGSGIAISKDGGKTWKRK